jgi:hypothetical protein
MEVLYYESFMVVLNAAVLQTSASVTVELNVQAYHCKKFLV